MARATMSATQVELVEDIEIYPRLIELSTCLDQELQSSGLDATQVILPEGSVMLDYCGSTDCKGQAWIRIVNALPYQDFPEAPEGPARCGLMISYTLEVGFAHCAPQMDGKRLPTVADQLDAVRIQTAAMSAMLRAIRCCANGDTDVPWSLGEYSPDVNEGGCLAGWWTVTVGDRREG